MRIVKPMGQYLQAVRPDHGGNLHKVPGQFRGLSGS